MSIEAWKLEKGMCRCCHNDGSFKNLADIFVELGQQEIYANMLQQCLNIDLSPVPGPLSTVTYMICEDCILRLRDACNFKQQVVQCEERFKDLFSKNVIKLSSSCDIDVKEEILDDGDSVSSSCDIDVKEETLDNGDNDVKPALSPLEEDFSINFDDGDDNHDVNLDSKEEAKKSKVKKVKTKEKSKVKQKGRPRKLNSKPKEEKNGGKEKKGDSPSVPKFHLRDCDYISEGDVYKCTKCEKPYDKLTSLRYHVKTKHYNIPRFPCPYCSEGFMTPAPLTTHKLKEHNVDDRFKCNACKGAFNTKVQLRKHINNFHMLGEKYKCEFCEYESFSFEGMYKHKFKHKTVKDYHCRFCKKAFLRKTTLDLHERIHTGDRRKVCSVCSKAFVQKASLNYHMTKYHPEVNF